MDLVRIDPDSVVPPFEQVRAQLVDAIESGGLTAESKLPTVRRLAGDLGIAANTVARAYRELELAGVIETRGRNGTFVAGRPSPERQQAVEAAKRFLCSTTELGIGDVEALAILRREVEARSS